MNRIRFSRPFDVYDVLEATDSEGCIITTRSETRRTAQLNVQPKALSLVMTPVGELFEDTHIGYCSLEEKLHLHDHVRLYAEHPDYYVSSIQIWRTHISFELKRLV